MKKYQHILLFSGLAILLFCVAFMADGTCDSGDSITHYQYSRFAFEHPRLFLDHWAKPFFVLLSAPFAHFGFVWMKVFNVLTALCTAILLVRIAKLMGIRHTLLAPIFLFCFPIYSITIFSGLTEPLFALVLSFGIYLLLRKRTAASLVILSFLPFCRSEGLVVLIVLVIYLLLNRQWRYIPWLASGHVIYSLVGYFSGQNLLWVFTKIPYVVNGKGYDHGEWEHYFNGAASIFGIPLIVLLVFGLFSTFNFIKRKGTGKELLLVVGIFLSVYFSHVIFWRFGLFHSYGLLRVMVAILPMAALIALVGLNRLIELAARANSRSAYFINIGLIIYVLVFPFLPNPAALHIPRDFTLKDDQLMLNDAAAWITNEFPGAVVVTEHNYLAFALQIDPFDKKKFIGLHNFGTLKEIPPNMIIVWDNWFAPLEGGISLDALTNDDRLVKKAAFEKGNAKIVIFSKSPKLF